MRCERRAFLRAGALGVGGLSLANLLRSEARAESSESRRAKKNVIILWMRGGPAHQDMWDPKPEAPVEYRGEFGVTKTSVPGIQLSDMLPMCAKVQHKWSIIRSLHHKNAGHSAGDQILFTGHPPGQNADQNIHPSCGSIVSKQLQHTCPELPAYVMIPRMVPGTAPAYLGVAHKPFETIADPANKGPFKVPNFQLANGVSVNRFGDRRALLKGFDRLKADVDASGQMAAMDRFQQRAWGILSTDAARKAFDLDAEPRKLRERYGFMPRFDPGASNRCGAPAWSQRILLARRLVEAGVRLVTVDLRWWDTHVLGFDSLRRGFLPRFDKAYSALIEDLESRGLLKDTMVVAWGEIRPHPARQRQRRARSLPERVQRSDRGRPCERGARGRFLGCQGCLSERQSQDPARRAGDSLPPPRRRHRHSLHQQRRPPDQSPAVREGRGRVAVRNAGDFSFSCDIEETGENGGNRGRTGGGASCSARYRDNASDWFMTP